MMILIILNNLPSDNRLWLRPILVRPRCVISVREAPSRTYSLLLKLVLALQCTKTIEEYSQESIFVQEFTYLYQKTAAAKRPTTPTTQHVPTMTRKEK